MTDKHARLFNIISKPYNLFFPRQVERYKAAIEEKRHLLPREAKTVADIGCGPGAFGKSFMESGFEGVTGVDFAPGMVRIARKNGLHVLYADASSSIPLDTDGVDLAVAAYVAHGLESERRLALFREMARIAKYGIILHDYGEPGGVVTRFVEHLEGGDYKGFLSRGRDELKKVFPDVSVHPISGGGYWYICRN